MPISGFKRGDAVLTPSGKRGTVSRVIDSLTVRVRYQDVSPLGGCSERTFRQAALRYANPPSDR